MKLDRSFFGSLLIAGSLIVLPALILGSTPAQAEATAPAVPKRAKRALPRFHPAGIKEAQQGQQRSHKLLSRKRQQPTPHTSNFEGPRTLEEEKAMTRAFPAESLQLEGAAVGRREMARLGSFRDEHSESGNRWKALGPVNAIYPVANSRTNAPYIASGRVTALAIDPRCGVNRADDDRDGDGDDRHCRLYVAAAGGGVWRTDRPFSNTPRWEFTSGSFETNAIGTIAIDPRDPDTIYAGTGEPNSSGDSAAGLGLYRSNDGGEHWRRISSTLSFPGGTLADGFNDLSISSIAFDPANTRTFYVGTTLGIRGVSATSGGVVAANRAPPGLYKTTDGGSTFAQIWNGGGASCAPLGGPCHTSWGVDKVQLDPADARVIYASAVDVGIWRSDKSDNGGAFTQVFFSQNQANRGSDRTEFVLAPLKSGKLRIYAATGATGAFAGFPAPQSSFSQVWRTDDARRPAAILTTEEAAVVPGGKAPAAGGWKLLTSPSTADPRYATFDFCTGQCWYDMGIYSPAGQPDTVFVIGSYTYGEAYRFSNGRAVLRSTTAGEPDPKNNNVTFTDMTFDGRTPDPTSPDWLTQTTAIHPDQHALVFAPGNPDLWFEGSDGGLVRSSGKYVSNSSVCAARAGTNPARLATCQRLLSAVPSALYSLNSGLQTLQFQHLSYNPNNPLGELQGGTQDNGTFQFEGTGDWLETVGGDGGLSGFDASNPTNRFHNYFGANPDINFAAGDPFEWLYIGDPLAGSGEGVRFYMPMIADPSPDKGGSLFAGLQWIWRTTDNGGPRDYLEAHCNEFSASDGSICGDWQHLGNRALTGGTVSYVARTSGDAGTLWASTASGRVYIFKNADAPNPAAAGQFEVSDAIAANNTTPVRFISGIVIDPANPNHGFVSYGGYDSTPAPGRTVVPGHVFEVTWDGKSPHATFTSLDGEGRGALGDLPLNAIARDDLTGDLYVANDFGVLRREAQSGHWHLASEGMPMVEVSSLTLDSKARVLYAATHGRGAYRLLLGKPHHEEDDDQRTAAR